MASRNNASSFLTKSTMLAYLSISKSSVLDVLTVKRKIVGSVRGGQNAFVNEEPSKGPSLAKRFWTVLVLTYQLFIALCALLGSVLINPVILCSVSIFVAFSIFRTYCFE